MEKIIDCRGDALAIAPSGLEWNDDILWPSPCKGLSMYPVQYLKGDRFSALRYRVDNGQWREPVSALIWETRTGIIEQVMTLPEYRGQGIAKQLLALARAHIGTIRHSENLTHDGKAWAHKVG